MKKIIVGLPSYNESKRISNVVTQIDKGLSNIYNPKECLIVNLDSKSPDGTREKFLSTPTECQKEYLEVKRGKGHALIAFWNFIISENAQASATFDADIESISPDWIKKLVDPILSNKYDVASPVYKRNRFAGGITNHIAYPLIYSIYGAPIRQPLAGEYSYSTDFAKFLLEQDKFNTTYRYGIDFFITANALFGNFRMLNIELGRKIDKPGFIHQRRMLLEVAQSAIHVTKDHLKKHIPSPKIDYIGDPLGIDQKEKFPHKKSIPRLFRGIKESFLIQDNLFRKYLGDLYLEVKDIAFSNDSEFTSELWTEVLAELLMKCYLPNFNDKEIPSIANILLPLYRRRVISFWLLNEGVNPLIVENKIVEQAGMLNKKLNSRLLQYKPYLKYAFA